MNPCRAARVVDFKSLHIQAGAKITAVLEKIANGNLSNVESVGEGILEYKLDWGPGYRVYFGRDGEKLVILVGGGTKQRQSADIAAAKVCWVDYKRQKKALEEKKKKHGTHKRLS